MTTKKVRTNSGTVELSESNYAKFSKARRRWNELEPCNVSVNQGWLELRCYGAVRYACKVVATKAGAQ